MKWHENSPVVQQNWPKFGVILLLLLIGLFVVACGSSNADSSTNQAQPTPTSTILLTPTSTPVAIAHVKIGMQGSKYVFEPATLTIKVGTEVIWTNDSNAPHTVSSDAGLFDTPNPLGINPSQSYAFTFTKAGTYSYYCNIHTYMTGKIIVTA